MDKSKTIIVIIDDDPRFKNDPFILEAKELFVDVMFFDDPNQGLEYVQNNLQNRMIIVLDLAFPDLLPDGHKILQLIRDRSFLIPVIIWSARDEDKEEFADLIRNRAFSFLKKTASSEEIIGELKKADESINLNIDVALEEWINAHSEEQKNQPYMVTVDGKQLTLNDLLDEIRMQTPTGKQFSKSLSKLTIDLISRNKEKLND
jgi:DNA-binding NtrC family response regulator